MNDPKLLREDFEHVVSLLQTRNLPEDFANWPELDATRRKSIVALEELRAKKNKLNPEIAQAKKEGRDVTSLLEDLKRSGEREKELAISIEQVTAKLEAIEMILPNLPHESVPVGKDEAANRVEKTWGEKPTFTFKAKTHWEIGENLNILDFERGAKLSGARFTVYHGAAAKLERALINFMLDSHAKRGYREVVPPFLVLRKTMEGSGQLPKFEADLFKTSTSENPLFLIPTSEVALCNLHAEEILDAEKLPLYYTAYSPCFRAEAGSYGRDVRGLIRQHQFNKVELVKITSAETSYDELEKLTADAEAILEALNLPYRRVTLCTGDMGLAASKTYDLEVWLPGMDCYREISSCSNTADFQSRRNQTRYRPSSTSKPQLVHMLNGSGLAVGRTVVAILENYQQSDGSVAIPKILRPYLGGLETINKI